MPKLKNAKAKIYLDEAGDMKTIVSPLKKVNPILFLSVIKFILKNLMRI